MSQASITRSRSSLSNFSLQEATKHRGDLREKDRRERVHYEDSLPLRRGSGHTDNHDGGRRDEILQHFVVFRSVDVVSKLLFK